MTSQRMTGVVLLALDIAASFVVFHLVSQFRGVGTPAFLMLTAPIFAVICALYLIEGYSHRTDMLSVDYTSQHTIAMLCAMLATLLLTYVFQLPAGFTLQSSRLVIIISFVA